MPSNILYHYTNADSLINIISSNQFWITKSNFMNDPEEIEYGLRKYKTEINKYDKKDLPFFEPLLSWVGGVYNARDHFILSLSLWDRYSQGKGYCIGLDVDKIISELQKTNKNINFKGIFEVNYHKEEQQEYIKHLISQYLNAEKNNPNFPIGSKETSTLIFKAFGSLFSFKQSQYKEIRAIFSLPNTKGLVS